MIKADARLSVIITSYGSPVVLEKCLASLVLQPEVREIVVSDCSPIDPQHALTTQFPSVKFLHWDAPRIVPQLRWGALPHISGQIVGALESRSVPASDWAAKIVAAHQEHPQCPGIGGSVAISKASSTFDQALYFCEYGSFAPPLKEGAASELSGANLSYKRAALETEQDLLSAGKWETLLHLRWCQQGKQLWICDASISFENTMSPATALRQRFAYGRGYASNRWEHRRPIYALAALALPFLLTARVARKNFSSAFLWALPWLLLLNTAWAFGELTGYLFGEAKEPQIF